MSADIQAICDFLIRNPIYLSTGNGESEIIDPQFLELLTEYGQFQYHTKRGSRFFLTFSPVMSKRAFLVTISSVPTWV